MAKKVDEDLKSEIIEIVSKEIQSIKQPLKQELEKGKEKLSQAKDKANIKQEEYEDAIKENPLEWVAGAFIAGILIGRILSK
jgi:ElaB/YqjD/DUF883 family membrane-anchored ribosome-binding protein